MVLVFICLFFFFFKQKTAYEMRISDWSSDVCSSDLSSDACVEAAKELGGKCIALPQDVSTVAGCKALAAQLAEHESRLDILVNNAGAAWGEPFEDFPEAGWDKVMDLNVKSPFFLTQALHPALKAAASRSEEHTSELQSLMRSSYAVFCLTKKNK